MAIGFPKQCLFEKNAEWSPRVVEFRQKMRQRRDELLTSCLTVGETLTKPKELGNATLEKAYLNFFSGGAVELVWRAETDSSAAARRIETGIQ